MNTRVLQLMSAGLLLIPATALAKTRATTMSTTTSVASTMKKVHINRATARQLMALPGVGKTIAAEIIRYRPFKNDAQLVSKVRGLGAMNIKKIESMIVFN